MEIIYNKDLITKQNNICYKTFQWHIYIFKLHMNRYPATILFIK